VLPKELIFDLLLDPNELTYLADDP